MTTWGACCRGRITETISAPATEAGADEADLEQFAEQVVLALVEARLVGGAGGHPAGRDGGADPDRVRNTLRVNGEGGEPPTLRAAELGDLPDLLAAVVCDEDGFADDRLRAWEGEPVDEDFGAAKPEPSDGTSRRVWPNDYPARAGNCMRRGCRARDHQQFD